MMNQLTFLIAPDFLPSQFAGWHMLNTLLQKRLGCNIHLQIPGDMKEQRAMLDSSQVDLIYANPFDAARLVREHGFLALARPAELSDEMVIAAGADHVANGVGDLEPGCKIAITPNEDVKLIGLRLLEPADLNEANVTWVPTESYQGVARMLVRGEVDAGFFLAAAYHGLSKLSRSQMKVLVESRLRDISHVFMVNPAHAEKAELLQTALLGIGSQSGDADVLDALSMPKGFEKMVQEDAEFMIDLMETLLD